MATHVRNKVFLIFPPGKVYVHPDGAPSSRKHCSPPTGLAYLAANLLKHGYEVEVLDILVEGYEQEVYKEPFIIYGLSNEEVVERVRRADPDAIGISAMFSNVATEIYELCQALKEAFPDKPIILGGQHATGAPLDVMSRPYIDYVLHGEADLSLVALMDALNGDRALETVSGLYYKKDGSIVNTREGVKSAQVGLGWNSYLMKDADVPMQLDELPYPAWELFNMEAYWNVAVRTGGGDAVGDRYAVMLSTRGCPHACTYCTSPLQSGFKAYRRRSHESVLNEIHWLVDTYGVNEIQFVEDNFFVSTKRAKELLKLLAKEFPNVYFQATGGTEVNALDEEMIDLMAECNFYKAILAIEAGTPEIQEASVDKRVNLDRLPRIINYLHSKNIETKALYMIGFPGETREQIMKTVDLAVELGVLDFNLNIVTALPGTPLFDECLEKGLFLEGTGSSDINFNFARSNLKLPDVTPDDLENIRRTVWRKVFEKKMELQPKFPGRAAMHTFNSVEEYETWGFKTKAAARDAR